MYQFFIIFSFIVICNCNYTFSINKFCEKPTSCSDGLPIEYPFWRSNTSYPVPCGYNELELFCTNGKTAIDVYHVVKTGTLKKSFYVANRSVSSPSSFVQTIDLVDTNLWDSECPRPNNDTKERYQLFERNGWNSYSPPNSIISIFYNCSRYPPDLPHITCLEYNSKRSYAFQGNAGFSRYYSEGTPRGFDWHGNCDEYVLLELGMPIAGNVGRVFDTESFKSTLRLGTRFSWDRPHYCNDCEETGGTCMSDGWCRCDDDSTSVYYSAICHHRSNSRLQIIIGVSAGVLGFLMVLFLVYRKRIYSFCNSTHHFNHTVKNPTNADVFLESYGAL